MPTTAVRLRQVRRLALAASILACAIAVAQEPLKNENIVEMTRAGIAEATMLTMIQAGPRSFDTSVPALIALKKAGVSDRIIDAMVAAGRDEAGPATSLYDLPEEPGIYANVRERLVPLKVELVTWRTGGMLKSLYGNRGHLNGVVSRPFSTLHVDPRPEFILRSAEGVAADEYQLLRFWAKEDRREFRIVTGGVMHSTSGAQDNLVGVDVERLASRTYRLRPSLPLQEGEYGFLPPGGAASASAASSGKVYTFRVDEAR